MAHICPTIDFVTYCGTMSYKWHCKLPCPALFIALLARPCMGVSVLTHSRKVLRRNELRPFSLPLG